MRAMRFFSLVLIILVTGLLSGCSKKSSDIVYTTKSDEALAYFLTGLQMDDAFSYEVADTLYQKAVEADPEFAMAYYYWSNLANTTDDYLDRLNKAIELSEKVSEPERMIILRAKALFTNEIYQAREYSEKLVELLPRGKRAHYLHANFLYNRQDWEAAEKEYRATIELDSSFAPTYNKLGYIYSNLGDYPNSELRPANPNPFDSMGEIYLWMGDHENSVKSFSQALRLNPDFITSIAGLGHNYVFTGLYDKARKEYSRIFEHAQNVADSNSAYQWHALSYIYEGKYPQAIKIAKEKLAFCMAHSDIYEEARTRCCLASIYIENGDFEQAQKEIEAEEALANGPNFQSNLRDQYLRDCYFNLTLALSRQDKPDMAMTAFDKYEKLVRTSDDPNLEKSLYLLKGLTSYWTHNYDDAVDQLQQADIQNQYGRYYLAKSLAEQGNQQMAKEIFAEIANYNRNDIYYAFVRPKVIDEKGLLLAEGMDL